MEPIPESAELLRELSLIYGADLLSDLLSKTNEVEELVPELVGLSVATVVDDVAFTLVASDKVTAVLDAMQYLTGGPCVDALPAERVVLYDAARPDDEGHWQTFARVTAAKGVATTLTLPILGDDRAVIGSVNLYAGASGAFRGMHSQLADIFSAWAPGAVTNADLSFQTRRTAEDALDRHRTVMRTEAAIGLLMAARQVDADAARVLLYEAARRAGVTTDQLARTMLEAFEKPDKP